VKRIFSILAICAALALCQPVGRSQETATVTGRVLDPANAIVPNATVTVLNVETQIASKALTNDDGLYILSGLPPGNYRIEAAKPGFKTVIKPDVILHVQDVVAINFDMIVGSVSESVTVEGGSPILNTTDGSVSIVVDRNFVENMPLNGRSFQGLILLTPGVVTNNPQTRSGIGSGGEFSVNGQRTESNYYTVDGVSANIGTFAGNPAVTSNTGSLPTSTALGTTQGLVSVDALEEFRVESSTYSAEYGRNPGGQFSFATRSGSNEWHGTAFDYLRNNMFDANNWFNNFFHVAQPPLRQNDFGGTLGGPLEMHHLYNGRDKTFFLFSYEGLRLIQPQPASISYVPTAALRSAAAAVLRPIVGAFPVVNCPPSSTNCVADEGNGFGDFVGTWSNPSQIDSESIRLDRAVGTKLKLFFRFSNTSSSGITRFGGFAANPAQPFTSSFTTRTYTAGATSALSLTVVNVIRLNYSSNEATTETRQDAFGGATAVDLLSLQGFVPGLGSAPSITFNFNFPGFRTNAGDSLNSGLQRQWNFVDALSFSFGRHQVKVGADIRRLSPRQVMSSPFVSYEFDSASSVQNNTVDDGLGVAAIPTTPVYMNYSGFTQDDWRLTPKLNLSIGLRWELNPAPGGNRPYTLLGDVSSPSSLRLGPQGTPLWKTPWYNFGPRLGAAYVLRNAPGHETILRGGAGVFFDTGQQEGSFGYFGPGFVAYTFFGTNESVPTSFPLPLSQAVPTITNPPLPPYGGLFSYPRRLQLPYTIQFNLGLEQAVGKSQVLKLSYVGALGRKLLQENDLNLGPLNPNFRAVTIFRNGLTSDYDALQLQFQRNTSRGLTVLASYTWSHSIDYGSSNTALPYVRGNSDFDVRHNFSGALSYVPQIRFEKGATHAILGGWGFDSRFTVRAAFPVTLVGPQSLDPVTGKYNNVGLDLVSGVPLYLYSPSYPGGRSINGAAFVLPPGCDVDQCPSSTLGTAPRNFVRGFGAWQMDQAIRRDFPLHDRLKLQFRAEVFNIFNHPNFGRINSNYCPSGPGCTFGQATATLAQSLGVLSPLYQTGGPRSVQFGLKLIF
jgi:hypothetical protein